MKKNKNLLYNMMWADSDKNQRIKKLILIFLFSFIFFNQMDLHADLSRLMCSPHDISASRNRHNTIGDEVLTSISNPVSEKETNDSISCMQIFDLENPPAVTYALDCGRFGDQLVNYIKALWIAYQYNLTLLYKPFSYSDRLHLSKAHIALKDHKLAYQSIIRSSAYPPSIFFKHLEKARLHRPKNLYVVSFNTPKIEEWEDEHFRQLLATLIKPLTPLKPLELPQNCISIALHVRTGAGYDSRSDIQKMPKKFPPDSFYVHALKIIADYFSGQALYIHLFTDHPDPKSICDKYLEALKKLNIDNPLEFQFRAAGNHYDQNVLEDFFGMMQFDCLVRPHSSFSRCSGAVSGPMIEITPPKKDRKHAQRTDQAGNPIIDCLVKIRPAKGQNISECYLIPLAK